MRKIGTCLSGFFRVLTLARKTIDIITKTYKDKFTITGFKPATFRLSCQHSTNLQHVLYYLAIMFASYIFVNTFIDDLRSLILRASPPHTMDLSLPLHGVKASAS